MINSLLEWEKLREGLDLDTVNLRISEIKHTVYYRARDLFVNSNFSKTNSLEEIIEERRTALENHKKDQFFLKYKKEYEELLKTKKQLEIKRDDKRKEILETLNQKPNVKDIPLKWLINGKTYNGLSEYGITTLWGIMEFIENNWKESKNPRRQSSLIDKANQVWDKWIKEIEEVLKKHKLLEE